MKIEQRWKTSSLLAFSCNAIFISKDQRSLLHRLIGLLPLLLIFVRYTAFYSFHFDNCGSALELKAIDVSLNRSSLTPVTREFLPLHPQLIATHRERKEKITMTHEFALSSSFFSFPVWHAARYRAESRVVTIQGGKLYIRSDVVAIYSLPPSPLSTSFRMGPLSEGESSFAQNNKSYTAYIRGAH